MRSIQTKENVMFTQRIDTLLTLRKNIAEV